MVMMKTRNPGLTVDAVKVDGFDVDFSGRN